MAISACASQPVKPLDDGEPAHNPPLLRQTAEIGVPGFARLRWGMTEAQIKQLYPDFGNAYEGRLNASGGVNPMGYQMLRAGQDKIGECTFQVTLRYFATVGTRVLNALEYIDMTLASGNLEMCRDQTLARLLQQNGLHPMRSSSPPSAPYDPSTTAQMIWDGPVTYVHFFDDNYPLRVRGKEGDIFLPPKRTFHVVYQDTTDVPKGDQVLIIGPIPRQ